MKKLLLIIILVVIILSLVACSRDNQTKAPITDEASLGDHRDNGNNVEKVELYASIASSLQDAILELQEVYEKDNEHVNLIFNFGSSGALMQQIEEGVDADLFISAGKKEVDQLKEKGLLVDESRTDFLKNDLVLIVNEDYKDEVKSLDDLLRLEGTAIAMGEPESVPAGRYTLEALENLGLYEDLEEHIVFTKDVRQVLDYVDSKNIIAGFCYASDAKMANHSVLAQTILTNSHPPIVYPAAIIKDTKNLKEIEKFFEFLKIDDSQAVFEKYGFRLAD